MRGATRNGGILGKRMEEKFLLVVKYRQFLWWLCGSSTNFVWNSPYLLQAEEDELVGWKRSFYCGNIIKI